MAPPPKSLAESIARNLWMAYRRGWKDAARDRTDHLVSTHPDGDIKGAYFKGRADFELATQEAFLRSRLEYKVPGSPADDVLRGLANQGCHVHECVKPAKHSGAHHDAQKRRVMKPPA